MDFGFGNEETFVLPEGWTQDEAGNYFNAEGQQVDKEGNIITNINENETEEERKAREEAERLAKEEERKKKEQEEKGEIKLEAGQTIEIGEGENLVKYTVDENGNLLDKDGKVFKEAKDVQEFLKEYIQEQPADENTLNLENIQKAVGIEVTDENGKPIEYEDTPEGVKAYINNVIENQRQEIGEAALNTLFTKYPILSDVINYYVANGNSLNGFGELKDRSNITIDDKNESQQESIIRTAWKEKGISGDVESYINYLKSSGTLLATAKSELEALQKSDKEAKEQLAKQAKEEEEKNTQTQINYWKGVQEAIKGRKLAGYNIPESIIITRDGKKVAATPDDFFNYLYQVDKDGHSRYENDLLALKPEERRDDEILRAYLLYTGGNYKSLVDMAINEEKIKTIRLQAKNATQRTIRVTPKQTQKDSIDLGY